MENEEQFRTKKYVLDHVLYEMEMYLYTYACLHRLKFAGQLMFNTYWNSHKTALRNLMDFFGLSGSNGKDEIKYRDFSFPDSHNKRKQYQDYYKAISSAINHITIQRATGLNNTMLDDIVLKAQEEMFPVICGYIRTFLNHLTEDEIIIFTHDGLQRNITDEIKDSTIAAVINAVGEMLDSGPNFIPQAYLLLLGTEEIEKIANDNS